MPEEIIGELIVAIAEVGVDSFSTHKNEKFGCGCLISILILLGITMVGLYYLTRK
jgi:hypothetical protein